MYFDIIVIGPPQKIAADTAISPRSITGAIYKYVINIEQTIQSIEKKIYISARCLKQIIDLAKGWAIINDKDYVTHQDIKDTIPYILRHRIKFLNQEEKIEFVKKEILEKIDID